MNETYFLPVLLGTVRDGRESENVARLLVRQMEKHPEITTQLFDPREMQLPNDDEGQTLKFKNPDYRNAIMHADGLVIVSPEYNHGFPGTLKRVLDMLLAEYVHRPVGFVGVSSGGWGGTRMVELLLPVTRELGLTPSFADLYFPNVGEAFDDSGNPTDEKVFARIDAFLEEQLWLAKTLRWGRENVPSKFDEKLQKLEEEWQERVVGE